MTTARYTTRQAYVQYDDNSHLLYLNEQYPVQVTGWNGETAEDGLAYTGDRPDGSTAVEASQVTGENRRQKYIAGLIGKRYTIDAQIAILANGKDTEARRLEFQEFEEYRAWCKKEIDELLSREI